MPRTLFHPTLDDPGGWPAWELDADQHTRLQAALKAAGQTAAQDLNDAYGALASRFGATDLIDQLVGQPLADDAGWAPAMTLATLDYFRARARAPRAQPGGLTNSTNRRRWARQHPALHDRYTEVLAQNLAISLTWRAIIERVPDQPVPARRVEDAIRRAVAAAGPYEVRSIELDLKTPVRGGRAWLHEQMARELSTIRDEIAAGRPALVEALKRPAGSPASAELLIAYAVEENPHTHLRLHAAGFDDGWQQRILDIDMAGGPLWIMQTPAAAGRIVALRHWPAAPHTPPLWGVRRWLRYVLPWALIWRVGRWAALRRRKRQH